MDYSKLNIETVKRHGTILSLEAELRAQRNMLEARIKDRVWNKAINFAENITEILNELAKLEHNLEPIPPATEPPCE